LVKDKNSFILNHIKSVIEYRKIDYHKTGPL